MLKNKKMLGMTLAELVIAIAILMLVSVPVLNVFVMGIRISASSYKYTIATFTAQMRMEELVGLTEDELLRNVNPSATPPALKGVEYSVASPELKDYNDFPVHVKVEFYAIKKSDGTPFEQLAKATVTVYDNDKTSVLCALENYINIVAGGV